jgi:hypothetical protein
MKDLFVAYTARVKKATDEEMEMGEQGSELLRSAFMMTPCAGFNPIQVSSLRGSEPLRRARSIARSPLDGRKDKEKRTEGELRGSEVCRIRSRYTIP